MKVRGLSQNRLKALGKIGGWKKEAKKTGLHSMLQLQWNISQTPPSTTVPLQAASHPMPIRGCARDARV